MARNLNRFSTTRTISRSGLKQGPNEDKVNRLLHRRGWEWWRAGVKPSEIRKRLHISKSTWVWLQTIGSPELIAYDELIIDEVSKIRSSASELAIELSELSVGVLKDRMANAGKANAIMETVLTRIVANGGAGEGDAQLLKAVLPIANITTVAEAYAKIYGSSAAIKGLYPTVDHSKAEWVPALEAVQGGDDGDDSMLSAEKQAEIVQDMSEWTPEQVKHFAETGEEPPPGGG